MSPKREDPKKDPVASLEELEKTVAIRPRKAKSAEPATEAAKSARRESAVAAVSARPKTKTVPETSTVRIRLRKSGICTPKDQKGTLLGLGLRRLHQEVVRPDTPSIRGMLHKVRHLVEVSATK